jgi:hypothetical protein
MDGLIETLAGLVGKIATEGGAVVTLLMVVIAALVWRIRVLDRTVVGLTAVISDQNKHVQKQQDTLLLVALGGGRGPSPTGAPGSFERRDP